MPDRTIEVGENGFTLKSPFNQTLVMEVKRIPGRHWNPVDKVWQFPTSSAPYVKDFAIRWDIEFPEAMAVEAAPLPPANRVEQHDGELFIYFQYDASLVETVRTQIPGAKFDRGTKAWKTTLDNLDIVLGFAAKRKWHIEPGLSQHADALRAEQEAMVAASQATETDFEVLGTAVELLPYQKAGVEYLLKTRRAILGDVPGLGKSAQSLSAAVLAGALPIVVVCPNSMKTTWAHIEIPKFWPGLTVEVVKGWAAAPIEPADVVIVNYEIVAQRADDLLDLHPMALIADEAHYIRNGTAKYHCPVCCVKLRVNSKKCRCGAKFTHPIEEWTVRRTEGVMRLARAIPEEGVVFLLTGTPIHNRPTDLIPQITAINRIQTFGGRHRFSRRYAPSGKAAHMQELNRLMREKFYLRRTTEDVVGDLPELRRSVQIMDTDKAAYAEYKRIEADVVEELAQRAKALAEEDGSDGTAAYWQKKMKAEAAEHLVRISVLKNACADLKFEFIVEWIQNFLDGSDEKLVFFAEHVSMVERVYQHFSDVAVKIRGGVKQADRLEAVSRFQTDPTCRLFVGNLAAASEGITLTAAHNVAFGELAWTDAAMSQAIGRIYARANDMHGAIVHYCLAEGTLDFDLYRLLDAKKRISDAITDGVDPEENQSVLGALLVSLAERGLSGD